MTSSPALTPKHALPRLLFHSILPLCFFVLAATAVRRMQVRADNPDEGVNLMKGLLVSKGYRLYRDIWNDQPPVFTWMLAAQIKLIGPSVIGSRFLVISLSTILLAALYRIVLRQDGVAAAITSVIFVGASQFFLVLSSSPIIGLPAICLGMISLGSIVGWRHAACTAARMSWLLAAALAMALSIQTKFFTATLLPSAILLFLLPDPSAGASFPKRFSAMWAWFFLAAAVVILIARLTGETRQQLLDPHLILRRQIIAAGDGDRFSSLFMGAIQAFPCVVPFAIFGLVVSLLRRRWHVLAPAAWLGVSVVGLMRHQPLRAHYIPLFAIPLGWLAAIGVGSIVFLASIIIRRIRNPLSRDHIAFGTIRFIIAAAVIVLVAGAFTPIVTETIPRIKQENDFLATGGLMDPATEILAITRLRLLANHTRWVFSDLPFYPFCANLLVPPELAVFTGKRIDAGYVPDDYLLAMLLKYRPEQILLGRFNYSSDVMKFIDGNYSRVWHADDGPRGSLDLYVIHTLATRPQSPQ